MKKIQDSHNSTMKEQYSFFEDEKYGELIDLSRFLELELGKSISMAGRIIYWRPFKELVFGKIFDQNGSAQFSISSKNPNFELYLRNIRRGDIIAVYGELYKTKTGELTLRAEEIVLLVKAYNPLANKWQGLCDQEAKLRRRYEDLVLNPETRNVFEKRFKIIKAIRSFLVGKNFIEVETPILQNIASGAAANPFLTHYNAFNKNLFLRIAPELYLKRLVIAGYNRVFEIGKSFRNEGIDPTHLPEFTTVEFYIAYMGYKEGMDFVIKFLQYIVSSIEKNEEKSLIINGFDFNNIPKISYTELLLQNGVDWTEEASIIKAAQKYNLNISNYKSPQALLDAVYKHSCVYKIINPVLVYDYPYSALAKRKDEDKRLSDQFQIILNKCEIVKAYLELNNADLQESNFKEQLEQEKCGDLDVVREDNDYIEALKFGLPPTLGVGLGIDRLISILTGVNQLRNTIFFPLLR